MSNEFSISNFEDPYSYFGYDEYDPLGIQDYLKKQKEESAFRFGSLPFAGSLGVQEPGPLPTGDIGGSHPEAAFLPAEEPSIWGKAKDWVSNLLGQDPDEVATREATQTIARREQMAKEQAEFNKDVREKGLLEARIPGANPEVGTPLDAIAGLIFSMPGGMGRGSFESRNAIGELRNSRADFLKNERTQPIPAEPVEEAAIDLAPEELALGNLTGLIASEPGPTQDIAKAHIRFDALLNEGAPEYGARAAELLNTPELAGMGFQYKPGVVAKYEGKGKVVYDPVELAMASTSNEMFANYVKHMLEHEPSHGQVNEAGEQAFHALSPTKDIRGIEGELYGSEEAIPALLLDRSEPIQIGKTKLEGTRVGLPNEAFQHTNKAGEMRASVSDIENLFRGGQDILKHDPYYQQYAANVRDALLEAPDIFNALRGIRKSEDVTDVTREIDKPTELVFPEQLRRQIDLSKKQLEAAERQGNTEKADELRTDIADKESLLAAKEAEIKATPEKGEAQLKAEADAIAHEKAIADFKAKKAAEAGKPKPMADQIIAKALEAEKTKVGTSENVSEAELQGRGDIVEQADQIKKGLSGLTNEEFNRYAELENKTEKDFTEQDYLDYKRLSDKVAESRRLANEAENKQIKERNAKLGIGTEKVIEAPKSEGVVSAPANILRKLLQETNLTKFNVHTLKQSLKEKGVELPAEVEKEIPNLVNELKGRGWLLEKIGGTYTVLAAPGKSMKGISKGKPPKTGEIGKQIEETLKTTPRLAPKKEPITTTEKVKAAEQSTMSKLSDGALERLSKSLPEGSQGRKDVEAEIARRGGIQEEVKPVETTEEVPAGKVPNLTEQMKAKLTPEEIAAVGKLFGTEAKPKKGTKEVPEEVRLAQQAAIKGVAEKETKKAEEKPPIPEEPSGEVAEGGERQKPFEVTLNDGSTHIVRATTPEEARTKAESVLASYNSSKTIDKIEEHLGTLERAAKYEIEPVKTGSEAVGEELKETKKSVSEEVKETAQLGRQEEQLRKAQTKEKFKKQNFNVALSNGRTTVVKARNEKIAREIAEREIKKKGSGVTVESVGLKPSALEAAITGGARKLEESGFLQNPVVKVLNAVKSITFGGDVGHLLRQGKQMNADLLFSKHASKVLEQFPVIAKSATSQEFFDKYNEKMYSDPLTKRMVDDFGYDMPGMGAHYKEEAFHGAGLAEEAPIIGKLYAKPSERIYTIGLNFLRNAELHKWAETLQKEGFTPDNAPEKYYAMARALNIIGQRGHFQPAYQKLFSDASAVYGAPRAKAARIQNAMELFRGGTSGRIVRTTAAKTLAFNLGLFGLLKATLGATFVTDSESSDYLKIRVSPKIAVDPWVGLGVTFRTIAKLKHGKTKSPYTGKTYPTPPSDALMQEFLGGVAPGIKLAWEAMSGTDLRGYQVDKLSSLLNVAPLTARSIAELLQEGDIDEALLLSMLQAGGEGVDVFDYEKERKKQQRLKQERGIGSQANRPKFNY